MSAWLENSTQILLFFSAQIGMLVKMAFLFPGRAGLTRSKKPPPNPGWTLLIIKHFLPPSYFVFQTPHFWPDSVCSAHRWEVHPSGEIASSISQKQPPQPTSPPLSVTHPFLPSGDATTSGRSEHEFPGLFLNEAAIQPSMGEGGGAN